MRHIVLSGQLPSAALVLVAAALGAACGVLPVAPPIGIAAVEMRTRDGATVMLYTGPGPCVGGALYAEHFTPKGEKTPGCWIITNGEVLVSYLDGERGNIPHVQFKQVSGL